MYLRSYRCFEGHLYAIPRIVYSVVIVGREVYGK